MSHISGLTPEEEEFLKKSHHKPKKDAEVLIDVHGNAHKVNIHHRSGPAASTYAPGATNFITKSDRLNHRFETTNEQSYGDGRRSRSNSPGRVPIHHRKGSGVDSPRRDSRGSSPAAGSRGSSPASGRRDRAEYKPSKQAEEMVAKMLEASIDRVHK